MPIVTVNILKQDDVDKKRELAKKITDVVAEVCDLPKERVTIQLREDDVQNVAIGGVLLADMPDMPH